MKNLRVKMILLYVSCFAFLVLDILLVGIHKTSTKEFGLNCKKEDAKKVSYSIDEQLDTGSEKIKKKEIIDVYYSKKYVLFYDATKEFNTKNLSNKEITAIKKLCLQYKKLQPIVSVKIRKKSNKIIFTMCYKMNTSNRCKKLQDIFCVTKDNDKYYFDIQKCIKTIIENGGKRI